MYLCMTGMMGMHGGMMGMMPGGMMQPGGMGMMQPGGMGQSMASHRNPMAPLQQAAVPVMRPSVFIYYMIFIFGYYIFRVVLNYLLLTTQ